MMDSAICGIERHCNYNIKVLSKINAVDRSAVTIMATTRDIEVMCDTFNVSTSRV